MLGDIQYVSVQFHNGVPFMYCYMIEGWNRPITHGNFTKDNQYTTDLYPFEKLPQDIKSFMVNPDTELTWFGSAGDNTIVRFLPKH